MKKKELIGLKGITKKDSDNWHKVFDTEIIIAPFQLDFQSNDPNFKQKTIHPFWITARVNRLGQLSAPREIFPLIVRNYLDPIAEVGNDFIFSSIETISDAREIEKPEIDEENGLEWSSYWEYVNLIFSEITYGNISDYSADGYKTNHRITYFARSSKISAAKSILFLYENLINETEELSFNFKNNKSNK